MGIESELGPDGEFLKSVDEMLVQSATVTDAASGFVKSGKNREKQMTTLMDKLVRRNPEGIPPLYFEFHSPDRRVVLTIPQIQIITPDNQHSVECVVRILEIRKNGFTVWSQTGIMSTQEIKARQDPLSSDSGTYAQKKMRSKNVAFSQSFYDLIRDTGFENEFVSAEEAVLLFEDVHEVIRSRLGEAMQGNMQLIDAARTLIGSEEEPKRKRGLSLFRR